MIMSALQTIIEKGYINDVILDEDLLQIELKSNELSSVEKDTLALINLGQPLNRCVCSSVSGWSYQRSGEVIYGMVYYC